MVDLQLQQSLDHLKATQTQLIQSERWQVWVNYMLEHSRANSGDVQPTDLNALANEYLRLAYHGLRSKNQHFNCDLDTSFDPAVGYIQVIPQDIGRMLLNLFTNAF